MQGLLEPTAVSYSDVRFSTKVVEVHLTLGLVYIWMVYISRKLAVKKAKLTINLKISIVLGIANFLEVL